MSSTELHLGVSLDGAGSHPAAWQQPGVAESLLDPDRLVSLARTAERGLFDFVSLDDSFDPPQSDAPHVPFALDATLSLARVAPATNRIGLVATATTTHTEPFHLSKNLATLDLVSAGRGAWQVAVSTSEQAAARFGRKQVQPLDELWAEADDAIEVVTRLWDSWEDDAVIRDRATGRYLDRDKVHYIDFVGEFFSVRGPSITPRSPQAQPPIVIRADNPSARQVAARRADIVIVAATTEDAARVARDQIREAVGAAGRDPDDVTILVRATVGAPHLRAELDALHAAPPHHSTLDLVGEAQQVAAVLHEWFAAGSVDGFLLQPDSVPQTLEWLTDDVVPILQELGSFRRSYDAGTLRDRLGLTRPTNRYERAEVAS
ncbi:MAG: LLM class flavin-dependent oxidoreductase [Actinobacteria bacterium]|nr:LLM class flavin-dependent oxidoreductase [Actinomycetota bacterium]